MIELLWIVIPLSPHATICLIKNANSLSHFRNRHIMISQMDCSSGCIHELIFN